MADIEKLIKGLKCCNEKKVRLCEECPYDDENSLDDCLYLLTTDALELLKEKEPKEPVYSPQFKHYVCPSCSLVLDEARDDYCPCCGVKIAWDENRYDRV